MKPRFVIGLCLLLALAACNPKNDNSVETQNLASLLPTADSALSAVDSLMWQRPDSALALLLPYFDTCRDAMLASPALETHSMETHSMRLYNRHYANLLLAELLYKNDYPQTNRSELRLAVAYFDSLVCQAPPLQRGLGGLKHTPPNPNTSIYPFLSARAHYINGVGHYEQGQAAEACAEYLMALEVMESHFGEKELVGKKAKFMAYTYNRLGDMFSAQFMMESSIACYEQSLVFCKIAPTSPFGVSNTLMRLGKQYDKLGQKGKAREYYGQALDALPILQGPLYRDIVTSNAFYDYQLGSGMEQSLDILRKVLAQTTDDNERLTRYLAIGDIFFEEGFYDSALFYLEPVFERNDNLSRQIQAANFLRIVYDSLGQEDKANECMRFLATHKKTEGENKALVSQLEGLFQAYLNQKQEQKTAQEKREAVLRTVRALVPTGLLLAAAIIVVIRKRSKKRLAEQEAEAKRRMEEKTKRHEAELKRRQEESDKVLEATGRKYEEALEAEQQAHRMEQAALSGRLKRSNQELRELKDKIQLNENASPKQEAQASSFAEEPVCRLIMERVNDGQFLSQMDCRIYKDYALGKEHVAALREAADRHFHHFTSRLAKAYPELTKGDLDYCCLYLLGLTDADIAALMQKAYPTVSQRSRKMRAIFGDDNPLPITLRSFANNNLTR